MSDIHRLLNESKSQCQALVDEIELFKKSRVLHEQATKALESTSAALRETLREVEPLTGLHVRRLFYAIVSATLLNTLLFVAHLIVAMAR